MDLFRIFWLKKLLYFSPWTIRYFMEFFLWIPLEILHSFRWIFIVFIKTAKYIFHLFIFKTFHLLSDDMSNNINKTPKYRGIDVWNIALDPILCIRSWYPYQKRFKHQKLHIKQRIWIQMMWKNMAYTPFTIVVEYYIEVDHAVIITLMKVIVACNLIKWCERIINIF